MAAYLSPPKSDDNSEVLDIDGVDFYGYSVEYLFDTAHYFEKWGILPKAGGYDDQPARWFAAYANWCLLRAAVQKDLDERPNSLLNNAADPLANWFNDGK